MQPPIISVKNLTKTYASGFEALKNVDLEIRRGEIFALLGPNGAGKTTLIGVICGTVKPTSGAVLADGHDIVADYRAARSKIGLVPQELSTDMFETVWATVTFSRGLFGKPGNPAHIEKVLRDLSLWDKKDSKIMTLSGGMKRRVLIAKALSHEPQILFLDEPTAGVDVELRRDMWKMVRSLRATGVTIILTTHYIEEAEQMADRIGVINKGEIVLVEDKAALMEKLGKKQLILLLDRPLASIPEALSGYALELSTRRPSPRVHVPRRARPGAGRGPPPGALGARDRLQGSADPRELARGHLRQPGEVAIMNRHAIRAIYLFEMSRAWRTLLQSLAAPVISTSLYFVVFGSAIGSRMTEIDGRQLRGVHRPRAHDALAAQREHLQRLVRDLHAEVLRHHLRGPLRADLVRRDRPRLRRRRGHEVGHPRRSSSWRRRASSSSTRSPTRSGCSRSSC